MEISDKEFAKKLDLSRVHWNNIKHGKAKLSIKTLSVIKEAFPNLSKEVTFYLTNDFMIVKQNCTIEKIGGADEVGRDDSRQAAGKEPDRERVQGDTDLPDENRDSSQGR